MRSINGRCESSHGLRTFVSGVFLLGAGSIARAGPYSTGLANTNPGAVDPGVPGFVGSLGDGASTSPNVVNPAFVGWATSCTSYLPAPGVDAGWNDPTAALGPVTGDNFDIVSLGDLSADQIAAGVQPGQITLSFQTGIRNGTGPDFAVFENSFGSQTSVFADLAFVAVSSDGQHFARFAGISLTPAAVGPYGSIDPTNVLNLAGKHINAYGNSWGTPFDLSNLANDPSVISGQVNLNGIKYVRLVDIPGNGSFTDSAGHPIYDAWLTTGSGGFDLEALGVLHGWLGGDANLDGVVNSQDLAILAAHWQQNVADFTQGDFNGDGVVDLRDLLILSQDWQGNGQSLNSAAASLGLSSANVPEPAAACFFGGIVFALFFNSRRMNGRRK